MVIVNEVLALVQCRGWSGQW